MLLVAQSFNSGDIESPNIIGFSRNFHIILAKAGRDL
jgi:hypothetical protein